MAGRRPHGEWSERNWHSLTLANGESVTGWIAGDWIGVETHGGDKTKPCLREYQGRGAPCIACDKGKPKDWLCYIPIYRDGDFVRCVVRVHKDQLPVLDKLRFHDYVTCTKPIEQSIGVFVLIRPKQRDYPGTEKGRDKPADISDWLPVLWSMRGVISGRQLLGDTMRCVEPVQPAVVEPVQPVAVEPVQPVAVEPVQPANLADETDPGVIKLRRLMRREEALHVQNREQLIKDITALNGKPR